MDLDQITMTESGMVSIPVIADAQVLCGLHYVLLLWGCHMPVFFSAAI